MKRLVFRHTDDLDHLHIFLSQEERQKVQYDWTHRGQKGAAWVNEWVKWRRERVSERGDRWIGEERLRLSQSSPVGLQSVSLSHPLPGSLSLPALIVSRSSFVTSSLPPASDLHHFSHHLLQISRNQQRWSWKPIYTTITYQVVLSTGEDSDPNLDCWRKRLLHPLHKILSFIHSSGQYLLISLLFNAPFLIFANFVIVVP